MADRRARVLVMVPALNESGAIQGVVESIRSTLGCDVLVVDDGSADGTGRLARDAGARVIRHPFNLGVGAAIRTGLRYARTNNYDAVVQIDGDGQHNAGEARSLVAELEDGFDLVVGSRFGAGYKVSAARRLIMRILSWLVSRHIRTRVTDTTSGFRAFNSAAVDALADCYPTDYLSDTVETLLLAHDAGLRIREIPAKMNYRTTGQPSARKLKSMYHLTRLLFVVALHDIRRPVGS